MVDLIDRALRLWSDPVPVGDKSLASFRTVYTDPVRVNGVPTALVELVERARMLQRALIPLSHEVFEQFDAPGRFSTLAAIAAPVVHFGGDESATGVVNGPVVEPRVGSIERRLEPATAAARRLHTPSGRV